MCCPSPFTVKQEQKESDSQSWSPSCLGRRELSRPRLKGKGFWQRSQDLMIAHTWLPTAVLNESWVMRQRDYLDK